MEIRKFELGDLQKVIELSIKAYEKKGEREIKEFAKGFTDYTLGKYLSEPEGLFVAEENDEIIGNCFGHIDEKDKKLGWLWYIAIASHTQGKGIGSKLLNSLLLYFKRKRVRKVKLGTDKVKSVPFYQKHGFRITRWVFEREI
ncbi:MAG: GNAT family N-acetyltransferase [Candidatus Omnitrophota bacterium]